MFLVSLLIIFLSRRSRIFYLSRVIGRRSYATTNRTLHEISPWSESSESSLLGQGKYYRNRLQVPCNL